MYSNHHILRPAALARQAPRSPSALLPKSTFGLSENTNYAVILGRVFKLHPLFDEALFHILLSAPSASIVVIQESFLPWNTLFYDRLQSYFQQHTTPTQTAELLSRIRFVNLDYYTDVLLQASVTLDTFPYGGK